MLPNENHGADSTLVEWTIRETAGDQRSLERLRSGSQSAEGKLLVRQSTEARWSFLETTSTPTFLTDRRDGVAGHAELKSWSLGSGTLGLS